jgi:hypothetical protein
MATRRFPPRKNRPADLPRDAYDFTGESDDGEVPAPPFVYDVREGVRTRFAYLIVFPTYALSVLNVILGMAGVFTASDALKQGVALSPALLGGTWLALRFYFGGGSDRTH